MTTLFGIRHHGPGCARSLLSALAELSPDLVLIEMPAEFEPLLEHAGNDAMKPPVALLIHRTDMPEKSAFYPFAEFSPEWNAIRWAIGNKVPIRCFDLPSAHMFALREEDDESPPRPDAFEWFAKADGYSDGERWWNDRVEERRDPKDFFVAILEAVTTLRAELHLTESRETLLREAWMRKCLRTAEKDGFQNIAVVCGAWHAPVIQGDFKASNDNALLKGLDKHKVAATWIPWTDERLTIASGYGAGIRSPGWYRHLWRNEADPVSSWLTRTARVLRKEGLAASPASVIEAVRLSNSLAGMRGRPLPGLDETLEAAQAVFCQGDALPLHFLRDKLLVGQRLGEIPEGLPSLPLQQDFEANQRKHRLKPAASVTPLELDLREEGGRGRSIFLHRLLAMDVHWATKKEARSKGTFKESWSLQWKPQIAVAIIDAAAFGNTVETAATKKLVKSTAGEVGLAAITAGLDLALLAALPTAVEQLLLRLDAAGAISHDVFELLQAIPALARIARYGDVRSTDAMAVGSLFDRFASRIHVGLPAAASGIADDAGDRLCELVGNYAAALTMLENASLDAEFYATLRKMAYWEGTHPKVGGLSVRLLRDAMQLENEQVAQRLAFALSSGMPSPSAAAWLEGFLQGGGSLLVHDKNLLDLVDSWLSSLTPETFQNTLPLLRRTFCRFSSPERARIASSVMQATGSAPAAAAVIDLDMSRAMPAIAAVAKLLDLPQPV